MTSTKNRVFPLLAGLIGAAAIVFFALRPAPVPENVAPPAKADTGGRVAFLMEQQWLIHLKLAKVEAATIAPQVTSTGRVIPAPLNQAVISPPVGGIINAGNLPRIGQNVVRGQVLATLLQTPTAAETAQIRVENTRIEAERRRLAQTGTGSQVRLNLAKTEFDRATRLYERKAYSLRQLQTAEADVKAAEAILGSINDQLAALGSTPDLAAAYELRAPISGTIVKVHKSIGEQVAPGESVMEIVNLDTVWVEAPIFERDLARLNRQSQAVFTTAAFPGTEFRGRLIDIGAVIDENTRAATALFEVPNATRSLRIGMQANVRLNADEQINAMLIPKEAVLDNEGGKIVYVLLSGEEFQRIEVTLGDEYGGKVAILSGLAPGQRVVTQGAYQLKLQELRPADAGAHTHEV